MTHETKLIGISGEVSIITNKISKQGNPKTYINKISPWSKLGFGRFGFINISIILFRKIGIILRYIKKIKSIHDIGLPTTCQY